MKGLQSAEPELFEAFLKSAQYLVRLQTQQDIWEHLGKFIVAHFPAAWLAFVERDRGHGLSLGHCTLPANVAEELLTSDMRSLVADVMESGFLATRVLLVPAASMTALIPIFENNQASGALLIGHTDAQPLPKELLNIYLALAGLAGASAERRRAEDEVRRLNAQLEQRVAERTAQLRAANDKLMKEMFERKRAEEALIRTEKLAAAGRLAATIAHEINNPLEALTNLVYLLGKSTAEASTREYVNVIEKQLQMLSRITTQTLRFHRANGKPAEFDLAEVIAELLEFYQPKAMRQDVALVPRLAGKAKVLGYSGEVRQVIANLLLNALDATPQDGRVTIHLYESHEWRGQGRRGYRVSIADTGVGIPRQDLTRIFEPFFTTKGESGTGLGLWVTMGIINRAGGFIRMRSTQRPGRSGTCFSIFLPAEGPAAETSQRRRYETTQTSA